MKLRNMVFIAATLFLLSCTKQVTCEGVLYSRYGVPMSRETIYFNIYGSASSYPTSSKSCTTDEYGRFYFYEKVNKKYPMELECNSDSGYVRKSLGKPVDGTDIRENVTLHW